MDKLIDQYVAFVLKYETLELEDILNRFIQTLKKEEIKMITGKTPLFLHTASCARNASPALKDFIQKDLYRKGWLK